MKSFARYYLKAFFFSAISILIVWVAGVVAGEEVPVWGTVLAALVGWNSAQYP